MRRWKFPWSACKSSAVTSETALDRFRLLGGVVRHARDPGDIRSESVLYEHARRSSLERSADALIAREEWHRLS
ncbi:hypothetical protein ASG94_17380 [Nocardioides sp. Soil805]|nr:hypothetical protein ASG94_17380 [Nocardioides sp. Soil805]